MREKMRGKEGKKEKNYEIIFLWWAILDSNQ